MPTLPSPQPGPLAGTLVIEITSFVSGPLAGMMLGQLGADVVKVEPPRGDPLRRFGRPSTEMSSLFANVNRGKGSVVLDLKTSAGRAELMRLLDGADVLLANWRPSAAERLGLDDASIAAANTRLIRAYISGYGIDGPLAGQPVFDSVIQARAGMTDSQRTTDVPAFAASYVADKITGLVACQAVLAALVERERRGVGDRIDLAMLDAISYFNFPDALSNRTFLAHQPPEARNTLAAAVRPVRARDGWLIVAPVTGNQIRRCCEAVGRPEWGDRLLELGPADLMRELFDHLDAELSVADREHWLGRFVEHDVPAAPCLSIDEHLEDPQVRHNQLYGEATTARIGPTRTVRYPALFGRHSPLGVESTAPQLDAHGARLQIAVADDSCSWSGGRASDG